MPANEMTYGVEIECGIDANIPIRMGSYHYGTPCTALPSFDGRAWKAESDGSLCFSRKRAIEFVSPVLKGAEGLDNIRAVCAQIKAWGGVTNRTCGLHVHVGVGDVPVSVLQRLYRLVGRFEDALYAVTGTTDRRHSRYCNPVKTPANKIVNWGNIRGKEDLRYNSDCSDIRDRYRILNVLNFVNGRQNTVEFRVFSGSLNPAKIAAWVQICLSLVAMAQDGLDVEWDIDSDVLAKRAYGPSWGVKNTRYMCHFMWKWPSRRDLGYGDLGHATFTRKAAEKTLLALAARYDGRRANIESETTSA